jgi:hypothetical protein
MVASPNSSRLPPRGPRDLGRPGSTRQDKQIHETAKSCFLQNRYITYHVQNITLLKKKEELLLFFWWSGGIPSACRSRAGVALDAGHHDIRRLLYSFPCSGRRFSYGAN